MTDSVLKIIFIAHSCSFLVVEYILKSNPLVNLWKQPNNMPNKALYGL